ncbi:MAG: DUF4382 domain-containing protein [Gammaproteobacteria bacterium]
MKLWRVLSGRHLWGPVVVVGLAVLAACGGGGTSSIVPSSTEGTVTFSIADSPGDFVNYAVDINQITLTRSDGVVVKALPAPVTVDLAQLVSSSQLFASATLPFGTYTTMSIDIGYANADISAENALDQVVSLTPVDSKGVPLTTATVTVKLSTTDPIVVQKGVPLLASLDFDLEASNVIDFGASPPTVTVSPFIYVAVNPADLPYAQASGLLASVDTTASTYTIDLMPLFYTGTKDFGSMVVGTGSQTFYAVNGATYTGSAGLQAIAALPTGTPTLAYGSYDLGKTMFEADQVYAGSSVPGVNSDSVHGSVIARSGNTLTVFGVTYIKATSEQIYHSTVTVDLGTNTTVYIAGDPVTAATLAAISVGSRVTIQGTLTDTTPSSLTMDAGVQDTGYVRVGPSRVSGTVSTINSGQVNLVLAEVNHHPVGWFNFAGTGSTSTLDADPANYEVATGTLDFSGLSLGTATEINGFVQPFGQAPPDFNAVSLGDFAAANTRLMVGWRPNGTTAPFSVENTTQLVIDLADPNIGPFAVLREGGVLTNLTSLPASPTVAPDSRGTGLFAIRKAGTVTIYVSFASFVTALQSQLNGSTVMIGLFARGGYDAGSNTFTVQRMAVNLR